MREYNEETPESTEDWPGERWTLSGEESEWTDEEQFAREELDCEAYPVPDDGCDAPAYDDDTAF